MAGEETSRCTCWQNCVDFHVVNYSDIVDYPIILRSKSASNRISWITHGSPEFVILGVKTLSYIEAISKQTSGDERCEIDTLFGDGVEIGEKLNIPMTYRPLVSVLRKTPKDHVYVTAQDLVTDFPRYVTVNAYFSLHHRGVSVKAGDELELMRVEKRCENLRGPVSFLICRYDHREIALPMETRGNFTALEDPNYYTVSEVVYKFPLPQIVCFQQDSLVVNERAQLTLDKMRAFNGTFVLNRRFTEDYLVGCPITCVQDLNDRSSDDSGISCPCPSIGKKFVFINVRSDNVFLMNEGILCDTHDAALNSGRRIFVDKMQDSIIRLADEMSPDKVLQFSHEQLCPPPNPQMCPRSKSYQERIAFNIPALQPLLRGPASSLSSPNLNSHLSTYLSRSPSDGFTCAGPTQQARETAPHLPPLMSTQHPVRYGSSAYPVDANQETGRGSVVPGEKALVLHTIVDLQELRGRRDKPLRKSFMAKVSKSKLGQKLHDFWSKERTKCTSTLDESAGGLDASPRSIDCVESSPIMNNKRLIQRNPVYLERDEERTSCNESLSSDDCEHYPGTVDFNESFPEFENRCPENRRSGRNQASSYYFPERKSNLSDSLRRNNLCSVEEKVLNKHMTTPICVLSSQNNSTYNTSNIMTNMAPTDGNSLPFHVVEVSHLSVQEVTACVRERGLERIAAILERNQVDGAFFKALTRTDFEHEPFNASPFEIKQLDRIQLGIKPKVQ